MAKATIVVPCYNESQRLDLRRFCDFARRDDSADFLFVNDGSRDRTLELLERLHDTDPQRFSFLHLARNCGKGEAVRQGMRLALERKPKYVGYWDADLATPLDEIPAFCRVLDTRPQVELAIATRMPLLGRAIERSPVRWLLGRAFALAASAALGLRIYDTQCGAKLFRVSPEMHLVFEKRFRARWVFDVEIFARLKTLRRGTQRPQLDQIVYECPLDSWRDVAGSKLTAADFPKSLVELAVIWWTYLRPRFAGQASTAQLSARPADASVALEPQSQPPGDEKRAA